MGKIPGNLRQTIAANIRACRMAKFPGRGGGKKCAEAFSAFIGKNVSPQQWSPWERGMRTPDETRLEQIAKFFGKTVEYMRRDNRPPVPDALLRDSTTRSIGAPDAAYALRETADAVAGLEAPGMSPYAFLSAPELLIAMQRDKVKAVYQVEVSVKSVQFVRSDESAALRPCEDDQTR